jgi:hypothetical protein
MVNGELRKSYVSLKRKPFLTPLWLAAIAAAVVVSFVSWLWSTAHSTTVVVMNVPALAAGDGTPALLLAHLFGDSAGPGRLTAIYVAPLAASRLMVAPLAAALRLTPIEASTDDPSGLASRVLREQSGGHVLILAPSPALAPIVAALSGEPAIPPPLGGTGRSLYAVTVPRIGHSSVLHLAY